MKTLLSFMTFIYMSVGASTQVQAQTTKTLQHTTDVQTALQRLVDPTWMHTQHQHTLIIQEGKLIANFEAFQTENFLAKVNSLKTLEVAHVSIAQPVYWARWEKNRNLLIACLIFTLKYTGKAWQDSPNSLHVVAHIAINPNNFAEIKLIDFHSFRDPQLKNKWSKSEEEHLKADRELLQTVGKPALAYYFSQPEIAQSWKDKITNAFGSFCFKYQTLTTHDACKSQVFKPQESPVQ